MKNIRTIFTLLIMAFSGICSHLSAQQTLRVYKHDGTMEVFFYSNLDSITFSNVDASGIAQDFVVTQNFHTPDSTYRLPVSEIDSVAFSPIPTVYKSNAVRIDGQLRNYVIGADSLTLYLKKSIPNALLPKVGDNIATLECDEVLPYGFFGKVENIIHEESSINVECTQASLIDIFDSLGLEGSATTESPSVNSRSPFDVWPPQHFSLTIPSLKGSVNLGNEIEMGAGFSGSYNMSSSIEFSTEKCDVNWAFFITPMAFQLPQVYYSLTYTAQNTLSIGSSLSAGVKWGKEFPLEAIRNIRIPGTAAVFEFFEEGGIFIEIGGKIGLNGSISRPFTTVLHFTYDNKAEATIPPTFRMIGRDAESETTLEGEAAISVGLYGKIGVAPLIKEMADIEAGLKAGATFSSSLSLTPAATPIEILNTEMYDEMDRDDFFRGDFTLTGEIAAKVLNDKKLSGELEVGDLFVKNPFFTRGIVPHFDEVYLTEGDGAGVLSAKATLSRRLMFDTPVGFALYDDDKKLVDKWWSPTEYKDNEGVTVSHNFEGLSANKEYTLHPITRAFKDNMVANPSSNAKIIPAVSSGEATAITHNSATLHGTVENVGENDDYTCGFYWSSTPTVGAENGTFISSTVNNGVTFSAQLDNLQPETTYYYRACATVNGEALLSDNTQSFTTEKEEEIQPCHPVTIKIESLTPIKVTYGDIGWDNGFQRRYEGDFRVTFENIGNRNLLLQYDPYCDMTSLCEFKRDSINQEISIDSINNSAIFKLEIWDDKQQNSKPWENNTDNWVATLPMYLSFSYASSEDGFNEEFIVETKFNLIYSQQPKLDNFKIMINHAYDQEGKIIPFKTISYNLSGAHWIKEMICTDYSEGYPPYKDCTHWIQDGNAEVGFAHNTIDFYNAWNEDILAKRSIVGIITWANGKKSNFEINYDYLNGEPLNVELPIIITP